MNSLRTAQNSGAWRGQGVPCDRRRPPCRSRGPCRVLNHAIEGTFAGLSPRAASSTVRVTGAQLMPSSVPVTRQPYGANQSSGPPGTTDEAARPSMPKSFQSTRNTRFERPRPQAEFLTSWVAPGVRPPSPSTTNTRTSPAPAILSASASPAATGIPWPDGPVFALKNSVLPAISAWPGSPPRRRSVSRSSGRTVQRPPSGSAKRSSPSSSARWRSVSERTASSV